MKSIQLTEEDKSKLLEMCKVLFPEYTYGFENDFSDIGIMEYYTNVEDWKFIHWFEFCMTHLANEIIYKEEKTLRTCENEHNFMLKQLMNVFYNEKGIHPIDYLYKEFKKLKDDQGTTHKRQ